VTKGAQELQAAIAFRGFETLIDRHGISGGEGWKQRLGNLSRQRHRRFRVIPFVGSIGYLRMRG
jgi:hypothetical protein